MKEIRTIKVIGLEIDFQRPNRPWNAAPNNGGIPNPISSNKNVNQVNNVDLSGVGLNTWCIIHSTASHGESDCPEFKAALNIFQQEIQNMEMTPNNEPSTSQSNSNPTLVTEMFDRNETPEQLTSDEEVYAIGQMYNDEVYAAQQSPQGLCTYNFQRRDKEPMTTSLPPGNEQLPPDPSSSNNPPPPE